jgi:hypothetical protein
VFSFLFELADAFEKNVLEDDNPFGMFGLRHALHRATQASEDSIRGEKRRCSVIDHLPGPFGSDFGVTVRCLDR